MLLKTLPWQQQCVMLQPYRCCTRNFCIAARYIAVSDINIPFHLYVRFYPNSLIAFGSKARIIWRFYVTLNSITYLGLRAKCSVFLSDSTQIFILSTYIHNSFRKQILRKSIQWGHSLYFRTQKRTDRHESYKVVYATTRRSPKSSQMGDFT
jgi:hypothetical protein